MQLLKSKWWSNDLEGQNQWPPFSIPAERIPRYIFGANLVILTRIRYKLSHRQAKFPRILSQNGQNNLECHGQWPPFLIPVKRIPGCMFGANLVIPAETCNKLSRGQGKVYGWTDGRTDRRRQWWWYPFGLKGQGVKMAIANHSIFVFLTWQSRKNFDIDRANELTHWGQATHICVTKLNIIGSDHGSSPGWNQAIIWTNAGIVSIGNLGTNLSENLSEIHTFSLKKMWKCHVCKGCHFISASMCWIMPQIDKRN